MIKGSILYVEDDDWHDSLRYGLQMEGWKLHQYSYTREAMGSIKDGLEYGLAIIDLELDNGLFQLKGRDVMDCSKKINPNIPIITIASYNHKPHKSNVHIIKSYPFDLQKLINIVNTNYNFSDDVDAEEYYKHLIR